MSDAFSGFLEAPSGQSFVRLRNAVVARPDYDFSSDALDELAALVETGDYAAVPDKLGEMMPGWLLSPRAHLLAGYAAEQDGDAERAGFERDFARACLDGMLESGDGTRTNPYRVTHVTDEYDLLEARGKLFAAQRQVAGHDGVFDLITCSDGTELWFDMTAGAAVAP